MSDNIPQTPEELDARGGAYIVEHPEQWDLLPKSPKEAKQASLRFYMGAKPCPHGHPPIRRRLGTKDGTVCYKCHREERSKWNKKWAKANPEAAAEASRRRRTANLERRREQEREWRARNRAKCKAKKMRHLGALERATPVWLTDAHWEEMNAVYVERDRISEETGVQHHVDHIVPLRGEKVCGLHVPWNLRVIPAEHNARKGNKWASEGVSAVDEAVLGDIAA